MNLTAMEVLDRLEEESDHEQNIVPFHEVFKPEPRVCCCTNGGKPYLLNGRMVVSKNAGCKIHGGTEVKWIAAKTRGGDDE